MNTRVMRQKHERLVLVVLTAVVLWGGQAHGKTVAVIASSDSDIKSVAPDSSFPDGEELVPDKNGAYDTNGELAKSYMRFELPADMGVVTDADLRIVQGLNGGTGAITFYIVGVNDDVPVGDSVNDYTWNNAPGNTPDYLYITWQDYTGYADQEQTSYISVISVYYPGQEYGLYQTGNLVDLLNADTDGVVTLFAHKRQNYAVDPSFAAIENSYGAHGPMLTLTYQSTGQGLGVAVTESDGSTSVTEDGETDTYTLALTEVPDEPVTILIVPEPALEVVPDMVIFTDQNWSEPQAVLVRAVDDQQKQPSYIYTATIFHTVVSAGEDYDGIYAPDVTVSIRDNDDVSCVDVPHLKQDLNQDCQIDIKDFLIFAQGWLSCTDPTDPVQCPVGQ